MPGKQGMIPPLTTSAYWKHTDGHSQMKVHEDLQRGIQFNQNGRLDEAIECYQKTLVTQPQNSIALSNLGAALQAHGKLDKAVACYHQALSLQPDDADVLSNLGFAFTKQGKWQEAVASLQKALSLQPDCATFHYNLGNALAYQGQSDAAVACYHKALSLQPDYTEALSNLGNALTEQGKLEEAVASLQKALAINPVFPEALSNLGYVLTKQGQTKAAIDCYQKALVINPDMPVVQHNLNALLGYTPQCAPREYVASLFNAYAGKFDHHMLNKLAYTTPTLLKKVLLDLGLTKGPSKKTIDLGCGTGLAGIEFREMAEPLIGIDLSENMVRKAEKKHLYDQLYVDDIMDRLQNLDRKFELIVASDVVVYMGDLRPLFQCVKKHAAHDALFVFSTEHADGDTFVLQVTGRYAHSLDYILSIAAESGFQPEYSSQSNLRKERDHWVIGGIYVLRAM